MHHYMDNQHFSDIFFKNRKVEFDDCIKSQSAGAGKGPLTLNKNNKVIFDLDCFPSRYSLLGYNHPIELRAQLSCEEVSNVEIEEQIKSTFLPKKDFFVSISNQCKPTPNLTRGPWNEFNIQTLSFKETVGIFGIGNDWLQKITSLVDENSELTVKGFLPVDFVISKKPINQKNLKKIENLSYSKYVINYFSKAPFYGERGRFSQIFTWLKNHFDGDSFYVSNLTVSVINTNQDFKLLLEKYGIISSYYQHSVILSFPVSLLETQVIEVSRIVKKCLKENKS